MTYLRKIVYNRDMKKHLLNDGNDTFIFLQRAPIGTHNHRQSYPSVPSIYHLEPPDKVHNQNQLFTLIDFKQCCWGQRYR